jgi:hypothetical protein
VGKVIAAHVARELKDKLLAIAPRYRKSGQDDR